MKKEHISCYYCNALISRKIEMDHFPLPKNCGGKKLVSICISCHDMKDRFCLENWPIEWIEKIIQDFPKFNRETKIFLSKCFSLFANFLNLEKT